MDPRTLYQELILDHGRRPRNHRDVPGATHSAEGKNPLCGDHVVVRLIFQDGIVRDVAFQGSGCAISQAAASTMTESVKGLPRADIEALFEKFHGVVTGRTAADLDELGKLAAFSGISDYPMRVKCATLAWHTLLAALDRKDTSVSTEE